MKVAVMRDGVRVGVLDLGRVVAFGDPDWVDPESPEFDAKSNPQNTYQLRPKGWLRKIAGREV